GRESCRRLQYADGACRARDTFGTTSAVRDAVGSQRRSRGRRSQNESGSSAITPLAWAGPPLDPVAAGAPPVAGCARRAAVHALNAPPRGLYSRHLNQAQPYLAQSSPFRFSIPSVIARFC